MGEVVDHGVTGNIVSSVDAALATLPQTLALNRAQVRATFERRFSSGVMARGYLDHYDRVVRLNEVNDAVGSLAVPARRKPEPTYASEAGLV